MTVQQVRVPRAPRLPYAGSVKVVTARASFDCELVNISASGALVALPCYCKPTGRVRLSFKVEQARLRLDGEVARACRINTAHAWGISFKRVPEGTKELLSRYVRCKLADVQSNLRRHRPAARLEERSQRPRDQQPRPQPKQKPSDAPRSMRRSDVKSARRRWTAANLERMFRTPPKPRDPEE